MSMRTGFLAVLILVGGLAPAASSQQAIKDGNCVIWSKSWEQAITEATERNVPIFLTIQQDENPGRTAMETAFKDGSFIGASRKVVCVVANGMVTHGAKEVKVNGVKQPMCKLYEGLVCDDHVNCSNSATGLFFKGTFDIPSQVWCKPDGKEIFRHTGALATGAQNAGDLCKDMERALSNVKGEHMPRKDYVDAMNTIMDIDGHFQKQEFKKAIEKATILSGLKYEKFKKRGEDYLKALEDSGNQVVESAKDMYTQDPKKTKELLAKIAKEMKPWACATKAEELLKTLK